MAKNNTSPLAMGRMQKGSAVSKKKKKDEEEKKAVVQKRPQSSSVSKPTQQQRQNQKSYGTTQPRVTQKQPTPRARTSTQQRSVDPKETRRQESARNMRTAATRFASEDRRTAAQAQKMNMPTAEEQRRSRENMRAAGKAIGNTVRESLTDESKARMQRQKSGIQTEEDKLYNEQRNQKRIEVAKNTGRAAKKGVEDTLTGYGKTLADIDEMAKSSDKWTEAKASKLGIDKNDTAGRAKIEDERQRSIKEARRLRLDLGEKQEKRQKEFDEATKNAKGLEKAWYGAVESGTGMLTDMAVGAATGTGQVGALASMGIRSYGTTRGQAEKEGATENEDRLYSLLQAGKEVGTEMMFQGAGLAKSAFSGGKVGLSLADKAANALTKGLTGKKADVVGAGVRLLGGTAEENAEEAAGWIADPLIKELTYGRNVRERMKESLLSNIPQVNSREEADRVASYFSTSKFTDDLVKDYTESGMSKEQATELAEEIRDMYAAYYAGDQETLDSLSEDLAGKLSGQAGLSRQSWSLGELADTFASTTLLTLTTGIPAAASTSIKGNQIFDSPEIKEQFGENAAKKVADIVKSSSDAKLSVKADAMAQRLESGKDITGTQKYDLIQGLEQRVKESAKRAQASEGAIREEAEAQDLVPTYGLDRNGNRVFAPETEKAFNAKYAQAELTVEAVKNYMESDSSISDDEARRSDAVKKAISDLHVGALTVGDVLEFGYGNELAREALKAEEGIDLNDYIVRNSDGSIDYAATSEATEDALFKINAQNAIEAARVETEVYIDRAKGNIDRDIMSRMSSNGQSVWKSINQDLDPRNISDYLTKADSVEFFYQAGRNTDVDMNTFVAENANSGVYKNIDTNMLKRAFAAGARDRIILNTPGYGQTVKAGSNIALKNTTPILTGQLFVDPDVELADTQQAAYLALAMSTNTNIHIKATLKSKAGVEVNGQSQGNDIYLNVNAGAEKNLGYVFMHEMTHQIKQYAPNEYMALENLVREKWFNKDANGMKRHLKSIIDLYSVKGGQTLSEEDAMEEIIADAMAEAIDDPNFAAEVCEQDLALGQAILNSIKEALRSIRAMFTGDNMRNEAFHKGLLSYLGILDEAEKMWINALATARKNKAAGLIADWQDRANGETRHSITPEQDADYMSAVESGDMKTAQRMVDEAAQRAGYTFGKVYHGTPDNDFTVFNDGIIFFTSNRDTADEYRDPGVMWATRYDKGRTLGAYIKIDNPLMLDNSYSDYRNEHTPWQEWKPTVYGRLPDNAMSATDVAKRAQEEGYDGVFIANDKDTKWSDSAKYLRNRGRGDTVIAFKSNQVKSADPVTYDDNGNVIPLSERFNETSPDIRYSIGFNDKSFDELNDAEQSVIHEAVSPDIRFSMPTERDVLPKARYKSDIGFSNAISAISGKQARINALVKNGFSEKQAKQIGEAISNVILDTGNWIEGDLQSEFTFIGWDDLINAEVSVRKDWKGKVVGVSVSAMVANGEYPVNFDLTTICNKREGIMQVIQNLTRIKTDTGKSVLDSVKLTDQDMWNINKALKAEGIDTACLGCFVEARRYYTNRFIASIDNKWNTAVRETRRQLGLPEEEYFNFAHGKKVTGEDYTAISDLWTSYEKSKDTKKSPEQRIRILMNEIIKNNEVDSPYLKLVSASDILTPEGISGLKQISTGKHDLVKTLKSIYGTSAPKEILAFTPYNSEIALLPKNLKGQRADKYLRSIGGIRIQSFSDFKIEHVIDHMQMVADMAARKFTCHAYSKVIAFPRIFGLTGQKINMSVMFDITPAEEWQTLLGCSEEKAKEYAFKYAGLRFVTEKPAENPDNRPYIETDLEGVHGYLTYLLGDADYINSVYEEEYQKNIAAGMDENEARRKANEAKPFEQSINYREAVELENQEGYKENVGIIAVAYGDEHLKILLADPNVRYVIPYHKSGLPVFVSEKTSLQYARNYEPVQNTKKADPKEKLQERFTAFKEKYKGEYPAIAFFGDIYENGGSIATTEATATEAAKLHGTGEFDVYKDLDKAKDIKEVANAYLEYCIENNLVPVFSEFAGDPNYYKMLFDFAVTDGTSDHIYPQKTVRNNYPGIDVDAKIAAGEEIAEDDYAKLREAIRKGASEENAKNRTRSENMKNVLDDILSKDSENSILAGTNVNAIRDSATDYTDPKGIKYSITPEMDEEYMNAYFDGDDDAMQELVDEAAERAGYTYKAYHHTEHAFTVFDLSKARRSMDIQGFYFSSDPEAEREYGSVRYDVYLKIENPYIVDSSDAMKALPFDFGTEDAGVRARDWLKENGYDAVIRDASFYGAEADEIIVLDPEQIKSSEPMLFEDDPNGEYGEGEVIPLSQRFDPTNPDIRYSLPTQDADGNILTDGQMKYFKNSMARDAQGRLVRVYHTTNRGGFTVFDPSFSDDRRSLFFASNFDVSQTYGWNANKPIEFLSNEEQQLADEFPFIAGDEIEAKQKRQPGYYSCYLNLENPLIVDAKGANWNSIPYGESGITIRNLRWNAEPEWDNTEDGDVLLNGYVINFVFESLNDNGEWETNPVYGNVFENPNPEDTEWFPQEDAAALFESNGIPARYIDDVLMYADENPMDGSLEYEADEDEEISLSDTYKTRDLAQMAQNEGHDGVIIRNCRDIGGVSHLKGGNPISDIFIAFSSNQVKDTRNENPTENPDIRYSIPSEDEVMSFAQTESNTTDDLWYTDPVLQEGVVRYSVSKDDFINGVINKWNPAWKTEGHVLKDSSVEPAIRNVIMGAMRDSDTNVKYRQKVVKDTMLVARQAYDKMKSDNYTEAAELLYDHAHSIIENLEFFGNQDQSEFERYKNLRDYLRKTKFTVPEDKRSDIDYEAYRRRNFRKILLGSDGVAPDKEWQNLHEIWPEVFTEDIKGDIPSIMLQLENAVEVYQPYAEAYSSEQCEEFAGDIADSLYDIIYEGEAYKSLADKYDDKAKSMRERHREAMQKVKDNYKEKLNEKTLEAKRREYRKLDAQKAKLTDKYEQKLSDTYRKLDAQKAKLTDKYEQKLSDTKDMYERKLKTQQRKADFEIATLKQNREYNIKRLQAEKTRAVEEERRRSAYKVADNRREQRERTMHRQLYNRVLKEYKDLTHRLLNPTKEKAKNIPEQLRQPLAQMLHCFDLEKERSKKLEEMYMIPTRSQLNFRQLKDALDKVTKEDPTAYEISDIHEYLKGKMTELADRVDGKTIDSLDIADLQTIKELLVGLNSAIKNGQQLEIDGENYQKQAQCDKLGEGAAEYQKLHGKAKTFSGPREWWDNIANMGELTPVYFFRQIKGLYDMYRQIRRGFDSYVRNEKMVIDKIADILAPYYKTNRKGQKVQGSEIEDWRHSESAETFDLIVGNQTITLTIAQKMSLYCLAKRDQAQKHMFAERGGVVASEITAGSKIHKAEELLKGKIVEQRRVVLTPADIQNIIATLTDEQKEIADNLQKLMTDDMAKLGNETSVKLTGIEMYKEKEYFPIKVQGDSRATNPDNIGIQEKIRNPGFSNPLQGQVSNPIIVDDIFTVVASHCNEMNQYAAYAVPITNFMKVYNGETLDENGEAVKIKTVIRETYGDKAITYIENFINDINGNSFRRHGGLDDVLDKALGQAKKAAVFANLRVALQQPTAIIRAFAVMKVKYFKGVKPSAKETQEMFDHCPIAQWKSWGYYDTHFGRDIEDVMMGKNIPSKMDYFMSEAYGWFDNMTWGMIWQAVKNEVKESNPNVEYGSEEFWELCNERASFVFDSTQVVDSPFHRSDSMRSKNGLVKQMTSFQAEPTLSFNVLRQAFVDAFEESKKGNNTKAKQILGRMLAVWVGQAAFVALAQSMVDALRRKGHKDDDDDEDDAMRWYEVLMKYFTRNYVNNFKDDINPINNIYFIKDIVPGLLNAIKGEYVYGQQNLTFQWLDTLTNGIQMCKKKWEKGEAYSKTWYECLTELFGGLGYAAGLPAKTVMRGAGNAVYWLNKILGISVFADDGTVDKAVDNIVDKIRGSESGTSKAAGEDGTESTEYSDEDLPDNLSEEQKEEIRKAGERRAKRSVKTSEAADRDKNTMLYEAEKAAAGYEGSERDKKIWSSVSQGYKSHIESGDFAYIARMRDVVKQAGGDLDYFDEQINKATKTALKKTIEPGGADTESEMVAQQNMRYYLQAHGVTQEEISADICYKSDAAKDLKVAFRLGDEQAIIESTYALMWAGITQTDIERLYKNRNRMDLTKYDGKYKDRLKSTGNFIWPTEGVITSHFGYRNAPTAGASSNHPAIDIGAPQGTAVVAADGGTVIYAGRNSGYGNSVGIKHDNGMVTYYNHLYSWNVKVGDTVGQGQQIAQVGSTGISTGPHLDFKILDTNGEPVDPEQYLQKRQ